MVSGEFCFHFFSSSHFIFHVQSNGQFSHSLYLYLYLPANVFFLFHATTDISYFAGTFAHMHYLRNTMSRFTLSHHHWPYECLYPSRTTTQISEICFFASHSSHSTVFMPLRLSLASFVSIYSLLALYPTNHFRHFSLSR